MFNSRVRTKDGAQLARTYLHCKSESDEVFQIGPGGVVTQEPWAIMIVQEIALQM